MQNNTNNTYRNLDQQNENIDQQQQNYSWVEFVSPHYGNVPTQRPWVPTLEESAEQSIRRDF